MLGGLWAKKLSSPSSFCNGARSEMLTHVPLTAEWGCLWLADIVAKLFLGWRTKILKSADAFYARRREGPYRFIQNRSRTSVVALKSDRAAEKPKDQLSREF